LFQLAKNISNNPEKSLYANLIYIDCSLYCTNSHL